MRSGFLYRLTFPSGKVYIGITRESVERRVKRHIIYARAMKPYAVSCAIRKYGEDAFVVETLAAAPWNDLRELEIAAIAGANSFGAGGYNMTRGGDGSLGVELTDRTKKKISDSLRGRTLSDEHRLRLGLVQRGKVIPANTRAKMSIAARKRCSIPMSAEQRKKRSDALRGRSRQKKVS